MTALGTFLAGSCFVKDKQSAATGHYFSCGVSAPDSLSPNTPDPCHPGRDHTSLHTPAPCVTGLIIRSLAAGGRGDSNFHSSPSVRR